MRIAVLSLAALGIAFGTARADIGISKDGLDVELYGLLDAGIGSLEHSYSASSTFASTVNPYNLNSSPNSFTGLYSGGISMSRVGLKAQADLGSDMKAFFKVESAVNVVSGVLANNGQSLYNDISALKSANGASAINGQLFSRAAYVGFSDGPLGSIELGRTTNLSLDQVAEYDPVQAALLYSPLGFSGGIGGGLGATENSRLDNSVKYENKFGPVGVGLQYKFKGSQSDQAAGFGYVAMLSYSVGSLSVKGTFSEETNTVAWATQYSNVVTPDPNLQIENTRGYMLTALYRVSADAAVKAGYEYLSITAPSDSNLTGIQEYFGLMLPDPAANASGQQHFGVAWVGGDYKFTKAFDLGIGWYDINTENAPEVGKQYLANAYSALADFTFAKSFDTYAGAMLMSYSGVGLDHKAPTLAYSTNVLYGVGLRFKF
jgi:general bacterial porin, GBP family